MHSILDYDDYHKLLLDAASGLVSGIVGISLNAHTRLINRILCEDKSFAILFCKDLVDALGLSGASAQHLQHLMSPARAYARVRS